MCGCWAPRHRGAPYEVASPRIVLPSSGHTAFRMAGQDLLLDGLTALGAGTLAACALVAGGVALASGALGRRR